MALDLRLLQTLAVRRAGGVWQVTLNRPEARNAMSLAMVRELRLVLAEAEAHAGSRVLVLRGAGGHFCAGGDLQDMALARQRAAAAAAAEGDDATAPMAEVSAAFGELCVAYAHTGLATVAVVEGTVMGGGLGLACVVDVCLAGASAVFRLPETSLGIVPAQIATFLVERLGYSEAKRLAVTGGRLDARAALALLSRARLHSAASRVDEAAGVFSRAVLGDEGSEGTLAFLQKRKPRWAAA